MTTFDDRNKSFENKFAHDEELNFRANARRNKLLGLWAAAKIGLSGVDAEQYAQEVALSDFEEAGDNDVLNKVLKDLGKHDIAATESEVRVEMERLMHTARQQIMSESK
jgi:hypothetical protein